MLADPVKRDGWARNAQRRVYDEFLNLRPVAGMASGLRHVSRAALVVKPPRLGI
jgi:hypothetical protein